MENNIEIWLPIEGCDGAYSVSNFGRVKSHARDILNNGTQQRLPERILKPSISKSHGYVVVNILRHGKRYPYPIHRLVAETFLGDCPDGMECAHTDGDRKNARLDNLQWKSHVANEADKATHNTRLQGEKIRQAKLTQDQVRKIRSDSRTTAAIGREYGVSQSLISRVKTRAVWKHIAA